jgi:hypothetical protein
MATTTNTVSQGATRRHCDNLKSGDVPVAGSVLVTGLPPPRLAGCQSPVGPFVATDIRDRGSITTATTM